MLRHEGRRSGPRSVIELILIVALALGLALLIQAVLVKRSGFPARRMEPTLRLGGRGPGSRVTYRASAPDRGDTVVFPPPTGADGNQCGAVHPPDQPCPRPTPQHSNVSFIKRIV